MLVKQVIYILCLLIFLVSIINLIYSIINKNKDVSKYIIVLSIIFILYSIVDISILPSILSLSIGFELLIFYGISAISRILLIVSIIVAKIKSKKLNNIGESIVCKIVFGVLALFPILMFGLSYFREIFSINNSKLILLCSEGEEFTKNYYAYAISDNYIKKISVGVDFSGYDMKKYLPSDFYEFNYTWITDNIEISNNKITISRNNEIMYKMNLISEISRCKIEDVFYKQK